MVHSHFFMGPFTKKILFSGSETTKAKLKLTLISIKYLPADQGLVKCHEDIGDLDFNKRPPMPSSTPPRTKIFITNQCCKRTKIIKSILQRTKVYKVKVAKGQNNQINYPIDQNYLVNVTKDQRHQRCKEKDEVLDAKNVFDLLQIRSCSLSTFCRGGTLYNV